MQNKNVFKHVYGGIELRTLVDGSNVHFLAMDVCKGLGLGGSVARHLKGLCDFEISKVTRSDIGISGNGKPVVLVSESGFYKLVMRSQKAEAVQFQRWICEEVLPEIRKTGSYEAGNDASEIIKAVVDAVNPLDVTFLEAREYCKVRGIPAEAKGLLGKIASRLCIEKDKPKRWTNIDKKIIKKHKLKFRSVGQYPVAILDQALALYDQGIKE